MLPWLTARGLPPLTAALLLAGIGAAVWARKGLKDAIAETWRREALLMLLVISAGSALARFLLAEPGHRVWDELVQLNMAHNLFRMGSYGESLAGGAALDVVSSPRYWPPAMAVLLTPVFGLFGYGETRVFALNLVLGSAAVPLLGLAAGVLLADARAGLAAAVLLGALPPHFEYSAGGSNAILSTTLIAAALLAAAAAKAKPTKALTWLALLCAAAAAHARVENALLLPWAFLLWRRRPTVPEAAFAFLAAALPLGLLIAANRADVAQVYSGAAGTLASRLIGNLRYLLLGHGGLWLAAISAFFLCKRERAVMASLAALAAGYFVLYSAHAFGDLGAVDGERHALQLHVLAAAAAAGLAARWRVGAAAGVAGALAVSALAWAGAGARFGPDRELAEKLAWASEAADSLQPETYVITAQPALFVSIAGQPAVSSRLLLEDPAFLDKLPAAVLFEDYWRRRDPGTAARLDAQLDKTHILKPLMTREIGGLDYPFKALEKR